jgi:hypothetical protein
MFIINYFNSTKKIPDEVDSSEQFSWYKNEKRDITFDFFEHYKNRNDIHNCANINYHQLYQFTNYKNLDFANICPFVRQYFSPSQQIKEIIQNIENKYNLDYSNICVLFYRGNDKITETPISSYEDVIEKARFVLNENPMTMFLIQSDETEFIEKMTNVFPTNSFYFKDEIRHIPKQNNTVDVVLKETNYKHSQLYLAITIIMSKCNYIICGTGNCSIWIMFYRENANNVYQFIQNKWV